MSRLQYPGRDHTGQPLPLQLRYLELPASGGLCLRQNSTTNGRRSSTHSGQARRAKDRAGAAAGSLGNQSNTQDLSCLSKVLWFHRMHGGLGGYRRMRRLRQHAIVTGVVSWRGWGPNVPSLQTSGPVLSELITTDPGRFTSTQVVPSTGPIDIRA